MTALDLDNLAEGFQSCAISKPEWTHLVHLQVGAWHVHHFGAEEALRLLRSGIRRLNDQHGTPNSDTRGYHETITVAYIRLIAAFLAARQLPFEVAVARMLESELAAKDTLLRFYSQPLLMSVRARKEWVDPDIAPL
jgi:hypothetical protein